MSSVVASVERLVTQFQIRRYEERSTAHARDQRDALERLAIARSCHLH